MTTIEQATRTYLTTETAAASILRDLREVEAKYPGRRVCFPAGMWMRKVSTTVRSSAFRKLSTMGLIERVYGKTNSASTVLWRASDAGLAMADAEIDAAMSN